MRRLAALIDTRSRRRGRRKPEMRRARHTAAWHKINTEGSTSEATRQRWATAESPATRTKDPRRENSHVPVHATSSSAAPARKLQGYATRSEQPSQRASKMQDCRLYARAALPNSSAEAGQRSCERQIAAGRAKALAAARPAESRQAQRTSATNAASCEP